jgi:hypothetical protein
MGQGGYYFYNNGYYEPSWLLEGSVNIGTMNSVTDIGGSKSAQTGLKPYVFRTPKLTGGISLTATHRDWLAFRLDLVAGQVEAHDSLLTNATHYSSIGRFERNLNFRSSIFEISAGAEFHPIFLRDYQVNDRYIPRLSPYLTFGIGIAYFKPEALWGSNWIELQPYRLEGQGFDEYPDRKPYKTTTLTFPMGLGLKYELNHFIFLRGEIIHRFTTTDYLDDVSKGDWVDPSLFYKYLSPSDAFLASKLYNRSVKINPPRNTRPRGNEFNNDIFWSVQFRVGFVLNRKRR